MLFLWWVINESFHFLLFSWIRLFLESLDFHEVLHYLFINLSMIIFWLLVSVVMHISCANIIKLQRAMHADFMISFIYIYNFFRFAQASKLTACKAMSLLLSLQSDIIRSFWSANLLNSFFCILFISLLFVILIMTFCFLQNDDRLFLKHCFSIIILSFVIFIQDVIFNEKCIFFWIYNSLLNS